MTSPPRMVYRSSTSAVCRRSRPARMCPRLPKVAPTTDRTGPGQRICSSGGRDPARRGPDRDRGPRRRGGGGRRRGRRAAATAGRGGGARRGDHVVLVGRTVPAAVGDAGAVPRRAAAGRARRPGRGGRRAGEPRPCPDGRRRPPAPGRRVPGARTAVALGRPVGHPGPAGRPAGPSRWHRDTSGPRWSWCSRGCGSSASTHGRSTPARSGSRWRRTPWSPSPAASRSDGSAGWRRPSPSAPSCRGSAWSRACG